MEWLITNALGAFLVPPGNLLLLAVIGALMVVSGWRRLGRTLVGLSLIALYGLSTHFVAVGLLHELETPFQAPKADAGGQAIVVLGGGTSFAAPEYGQDTVSPPTLVRLRYAAYLHRILKQPLMATGGAPQGNTLPEAEQMKASLEKDFQVPVQWVERGSNNTLENARLSYRLLSTAGVTRIYLVTHARHMPRARLAFERAGFAVIPAPTGYATRFGTTVLDFLPNAQALEYSRDFFRETIGIGWYHLRLRWGN